MRLSAAPAAGAGRPGGPVVALCAAMMLLLATACGDDPKLLTPPPDSADGGGGGAVQRTDFSVWVVPAGEDARVTESLGWPNGVVLGAEVRLNRAGETEGAAQVTDSAGRAFFPGLLPGNYEVSVLRQLDQTERQRLAGGEFGDVTAFGGGEWTQVDGSTDSLTLEVVAGRQGSLVISELFNALPLTGNAFYRTGQYIEFYNNSDSTIYMDGKILAAGMWFNHEWPDRPCDVLEAWRTDERGIWSHRYVQFPGSGRQYPVRPGGTVLVAQDAIDHRPLAEGMHDLRMANFEYVGPVDVDNPNVPNVVDVGARKWLNPAGEAGLYLGVLHETYVLAERLDPSELRSEDLPTASPPRHELIPAEKILDVAVFSAIPALSASENVIYCDPFVNRRFDRQRAQLLDAASLSAIQRTIMGMRADGRPMLQRTKTSSADFQYAAPSPGRAP